MLSKTITLLWLTIFLTSSISNAAFKKEELNLVEPKLEYQAPREEYVLYDIGNDWLVINTYFLQKIHLKLLECDKETALMSSMISSPKQPAWYESKLVIAGIPIAFSTGLILGLFLR